VSNGAFLASIGGNPRRSNQFNRKPCVITGTNSIWTNTFALLVGDEGSQNQLDVTDGARLYNSWSRVGAYSLPTLFRSAAPAHSGINQVPSSWAVRVQTTTAGRSGALVCSTDGTVALNPGQTTTKSCSPHRFAVDQQRQVEFREFQFRELYTVCQGALLANNSYALVGTGIGNSSNQVVVSGPGSTWTCGGWLILSDRGNANSIIISNGARSDRPRVIPGLERKQQHSGRGRWGILRDQRGEPVGDPVGQLLVNSGTVSAGLLLATNPGNGKCYFYWGTMNLKNARVQNGSPLLVVMEPGAQPSTLGGGTNLFQDGLVIAPERRLPASGMLQGACHQPGTAWLRRQRTVDHRRVAHAPTRQPDAISSGKRSACPGQSLLAVSMPQLLVAHCGSPSVRL